MRYMDIGAWVNHDWSDGLQLESVEDFTEIHVQTRNSLYEITAIDGFSREIVVRGGRFFPEKTRAQVDDRLRATFPRSDDCELVFVAKSRH